MPNKLEWKNLLRYLCPACDEPLVQEGGLHYCSERSCTFRVSAGRFNYLVAGMQSKKPRMFEDPNRNLSELNNL